MSARSARDSIMRPPRHQSRENAKRAASAACQRCRLWNLEDLLGSRWKTLSAAKRPNLRPGMTVPDKRASCRSLRPLTRSTKPPKSHPLDHFHHCATNQPPRPHPRPKTPRPPRPSHTPQPQNHHRLKLFFSTTRKPKPSRLPLLSQCLKITP